MWIDAEKLDQFYRTPLGFIAQNRILRNLGDIWCNVRQLVVVGYGFCHPYLDLFRGEASHVGLLMPGPQGALPWPKGRPNCVSLIEEMLLPLRDQSVDRLIFCHAFEFTDDPQLLLEEAWRVLKEGGEILIIVPNRRSVWSQSAQTPFGYGTPYSGPQLFDVLAHAGFTPHKPRYCLYTPPTHRTFAQRFAGTFESMLPYFSKRLGGVMLFPAKKEVFAVRPERNFAWGPRFFKPTISGGI